MSYSQMVDLLRKENKNEIVFVKAGAFYIAVEEDAVFLNKKLKLKCTCYRKNKLLSIFFKKFLIKRIFKCSIFMIILL